MSAPSFAAEGSTIAGPIGGNDVRSALLPPPGLYGGALVVASRLRKFFDGNGDPVPSLNALDISTGVTEPFMLYVPDRRLFGGSLGAVAAVPLGARCGRAFETTSSDCITGLGDPYLEVAWSRFFGTLRPSRYSGAPPIPEGLAVALGFGVLVPAGNYDEELAVTHALTLGNNISDFAPTVAFTYTTPPILAEGTELSAKLYWNNYLENAATDYWTGDLISVDFAVTERIGRFQAGLAGLYGAQIEDDELAGIPIPPDGRRVETMLLGPILVYDMPERGTSLKVKGLWTVITENAPEQYGVVFGLLKKF